MDLVEVMRTTFAAREFTDEPLPDRVLYRILDNARFAASGGNRQGWRVVVVRERATREAIVELMVPAIKRYVAQVAAGENPLNTVHPSRVSEEAVERTEVPPRTVAPILEAPVVLVVCVDLGVVASMDRYLDRVGLTSGASIYPFVWNVLLAAGNEGFGGVITTFATAAEPAMQRLLGLAPEQAVAAVVPLGRPKRVLTRLSRRPVEDFARLERWDGPAFEAPEE